MASQCAIVTGRRAIRLGENPLIFRRCKLACRWIAATARTLTHAPHAPLLPPPAFDQGKDEFKPLRHSPQQPAAGVDAEKNNFPALI
jgi:hypothetical protein